MHPSLSCCVLWFLVKKHILHICICATALRSRVVDACENREPPGIGKHTSQGASVTLHMAPCLRRSSIG